MKILLIGASGTIGKAVDDQLSKEHEVVRAGKNRGDVIVDLGDKSSIEAMFDKVGNVDAVISTAGQASFGSILEQDDADYQAAWTNKIMGHVNLVRVAQRFVNANGSIVLTGGILSRKPMAGGASVSMANGALESFVRAVALELGNIRLNIVAPAFVKETMEMLGMDSSSGISAEDTARVYGAALFGNLHGEILDVPDHI